MLCQACAPKRLPWPGVTQNDNAAFQKMADQFRQRLRGVRTYERIGTQLAENGDTFETWKTPNGYVNVGPCTPSLTNNQKFDLVVYHDDLLGPETA